MRRGWQRRGAKCWDQGKEWKFSTNRRARRQDSQMEYQATHEVVCHCKPGDGSVVCPNEDKCYEAWTERRMIQPEN